MKNFCIIVLIFWIVSQIVLILNIEIRFSNVKSNYSQEYKKSLESGMGQLNATWYITSLYRNEFNSTYGTPNVTIPSRIVRKHFLSTSKIRVFTRISLCKIINFSCSSSRISIALRFSLSVLVLNEKDAIFLFIGTILILIF